jgi:hypothetical protein
MKLRSLVFAAFLALPLASFAEVDFSVNIAPPVMPVYEQPLCPVAGYIWTPGYWAYDNDYYWVPGVWVPPPRVGLLWTPPWWGWNNGAYVFNQGYWGPHVGFYGGINYGYGYFGDGYWGGRWEGNAFRYNTAVTRVNNTVIHNTYVDRNVVNKEVNRSHTSFNGPNGVKAEATAEQKAAAANAKKVGPTSQQLSRQQAASKDQNLRASVNKGNPNNEAIKSFNKSEGAGQGKGAAGLEAAGGAAGTGAGNKPGNLDEHNLQGAGAGKGGDKPGYVTERNLQGAEAGNTAGATGNKLKTGNHGNMRTTGGNQAKMHTGKMAESGGAAHGPHAMNQMSRNPQMGARNAQMGGKHPQMGGGNRPAPKGQQQQGKKKPGQPY